MALSLRILDNLDNFHNLWKHCFNAKDKNPLFLSTKGKPIRNLLQQVNLKNLEGCRMHREVHLPQYDTYNCNMAREVASQRQPKGKCPEFRAYGEDRFEDAQSQVPIPHCSVLEVYKSNQTDIPLEDDIRRDLRRTF